MITVTASIQTPIDPLFKPGAQGQDVMQKWAESAIAGLDVRVDVSLDLGSSSGDANDQRFVASGGPSNAVQFNGVDNYIEIDAPFPFGDQVTVEMWLRGEPREAHQFFATDKARYKRLLSVHVPWSDGNVYFDGGGDDSNNFDRIVKKLEASDTKDTWNHWAFVHDSSAGRMAIYKNGVLWHEASGTTRSMLGCTRFVIGADGNGKWPHPGAIGEFRVWSVARTAAQISGNMNRRIPAGDTGLIASYALDQAATTISDRSGNGRHGTLRGSPVTVAGPTLS